MMNSLLEFLLTTEIGLLSKCDSLSCASPLDMVMAMAWVVGVPYPVGTGILESDISDFTLIKIKYYILTCNLYVGLLSYRIIAQKE
jgi:hypothetical protein